MIKLKPIYKIGFFTLIYSLVFATLVFAFLYKTQQSEENILLPQRNQKNLQKVAQLFTDQTSDEGIGGAYIPDILAPPVTYFQYTIKSGDSVHSLSRKFGIDEVTIIKLNNIKIPSNIALGAKMIIPNQDGIMVKVNNDLDKIADQYKYDKQDLLRINHVVIDKKIDQIFVPGIHYDQVTKYLMLGEYFRRPAYGRFTSYFGYRRDPWTGRRSFHTGVDIANKRGGYIYSAAPGKVIYTGWHPVYGKIIKIRHTSGYMTIYGHLSRIYVKRNQWVSSGTILGLMGSSGRSTGIHLHFEIRKYGRLINPFSVTVF
ncbi:MAG: M23 family metallopeptidase [Spirochaetes bacterium]|nr:M23 family metallopeptidase [Spirochaetota bacterium]